MRVCLKQTMKAPTVVVLLLLICTFVASEESKEKKIEEKSRDHLDEIFRLFHNLNQKENHVHHRFRNLDQQENHVNGLFRNWDHGKHWKVFYLTRMAHNDSSNSDHNLGQQNLLPSTVDSSNSDHKVGQQNLLPSTVDSSNLDHKLGQENLLLSTVWNLLFPTSNIARFQDSAEMSMDLEQPREMKKVLETTEIPEKMDRLMDDMERKITSRILRLHILALGAAISVAILIFCCRFFVRELKRNFLVNYYNNTLRLQLSKPKKVQLSKFAAAHGWMNDAIIKTHNLPKISPDFVKTTDV